MILKYIDASGGTYSVFPTSQSLEDWATYRTVMTEGTGADTGRYAADIDDAHGSEWAVFAGSTQPASWDLALEVLSVDPAISAAEVKKIPRLAAAVSAGAGVRRTKIAATSSTLDETLGPTP
jgi:hypothetical protein